MERNTEQWRERQKNVEKQGEKQEKMIERGREAYSSKYHRIFLSQIAPQKGRTTDNTIIANVFPGELF